MTLSFERRSSSTQMHINIRYGDLFYGVDGDPESNS